MDRSKWTYKKFEDALQKVKYTTKIQSSDYLQEGIVPVISQEDDYISGYWNNADDAFKVESPLVIFGDHSRVIKYVDFDFVLGADGVKILQPKDFLEARFLYHYLKWFKVPSLGYSRHYKLLKEISLPIPPLSEQKRIVSELDLLSSIIEKKKAQLKEYDQLAQSIFYDMFGDPITNEKGWEVKKLEEVCENCDSLRKPITAKDRVQGEIPYYGASGIVDYVKDFIFDGEYLLISEDGANLLARSTPIAFSIKGKTWVNNHAHVLKFSNRFVQQYVEFTINLRDISLFVTGCAQPKLTQANLNKIPIAFPPLSLQQQFAEKIEAIEKQKEQIKQSIAEVETLFNSRMDYYFN